MFKSVEDRNILAWQEAYKAGDFDGEDVATQVDAGWVSWSSPDEELAAKTKSFGAAIVKIKDSGKVNVSGNYIFFMEEPWQDTSFACMKFAGIDDGNVEYKITLNEPDERFDKDDMKGRKWHVYGGPNRQFRKPLKAFKTDSTLAKWLNTAW